MLHKPYMRAKSTVGSYSIALSVSLALGLFAAPGAAQDTLNVATWGGAYGRAQEVAIFEPFARKTGTVIATELYGGDNGKLNALLANKDTPLDVVDISAATLDALCKSGALAQIDEDALEASASTDEKDANGKSDFFPGAVSKCGVAAMAWSTAIAYNRKSLGRAKPTTISALLDIKSFPGKRVLPNNAQRTLELALLADGVPPSSLYAELGTVEGADRAFAALDKIKDNVLLWDKAGQPMTWLVEGKASMAASYSGRLFRAALGDRNIGILWDGQIYDLDAWAIPKSSKNQKEAMRFIRFATAPTQLAAQARLTAYGPMRASAIAKVGKHPIVGVKMRRFLPTAQAGFQNALQFDENWWGENGAALNQRFAAWAAEVRAKEAARAAEAKAKAEAAP